ncbi:MAG: hypothetical protein AAF456_24490 [Planctomycetota bacterium]
MSNRTNLIAFLAVVMALTVTQSALAQGRGGQRGGGWMRGGGNLGLLQDESVQGELELMDDQIEELTIMRDEFRQEMMDTFRDFRNLNEDERQDLMDEMRERASEMEDEANAVLLPHQVDRLKQLGFQRNASRGGVGGLAGNDQLVEALGITEEQQEAMVAAAEEAAQKLEEKIADLRKQAQDEVLAVLTEEQREKFNELMGEPFQFSQDRGGFQQRGGGDRGGREGQGRRGPGGGDREGGGGGRSDF